MSNLSVRKALKVKGAIKVPGDKSISHRAIMLSSLAMGESKIEGFLPSADCQATIECFQKLGVWIESREQKAENRPRPEARSEGAQVIIKGKGLHGLNAPQGVLDVGNSGTTIRLLTGILAGQAFSSEITGDSSIRRRPMRRIVDPLRAMGAGIEGDVKGDNIYAPLKILGGKLRPIRYELPVASAQVKSAVLLAGLFAEGETEVIEKNQARDHTERMLEYLGADIKGTRIKGLKEFDGAEIDIPGDLSSASFFMAAALLVPGSELLIREVGVNPTRTGILEIFHRMGAGIEVKDEEIISGEPRANILIQSSKLKAQNFSGEIIPRIIDEIPIIAVAATQAEGTTEISGARELRIKESDRIKTISTELKKMGAKIKEKEDGMIIEGPVKLKGAKVKSYGDHRVAMSLAIAGLLAEGETVIEDTDCIETSFPGFERILKEITS